MSSLGETAPTFVEIAHRIVYALEPRKTGEGEILNWRDPAAD